MCFRNEVGRISSSLFNEKFLTFWLHILSNYTTSQSFSKKCIPKFGAFKIKIKAMSGI